MSDFSYRIKLFYRIKLLLNKVNDSWSRYFNLKASRDKARRLRKSVVKRKGQKIVDKKLKNTIKKYCKSAFGSKSYWPWVALYTEMRGEFREGWVPDDYYRFQLLPEMNPEKYRRFSEAKGIDYTLFKESVVEPLFVRLNGLYYDKDKVIKEKSEVEQYLCELDKEIIIKPDDGLGGKGIIFKNSKNLSLEELSENTDIVFQEVVKQHQKLNKLYPHSVNTLRVLTSVNKNGAIKAKFIIIRFGMGDSKTDNLSNGGGWIYVNKNGTVEPHAYDLDGTYIGKRHPDTGTRYSDLEIPFVDKVISFCKNVHSRFPYNRVVGWDTFIDEKGEPKLIEWNANNPLLGPVEAYYGPFFDELIEY